MFVEVNTEETTLLESLQQYPILESLFKKTWFISNLSKKEDRHVILELFLEEKLEPDDIKNMFDNLTNQLKAGRVKEFISTDKKTNKLLYVSNFLKNLEITLTKLQNIKGINRIVRKLKESNQHEDFLLTILQVELIASVSEYFDIIEVENTLNFKVQIDNRVIHFVFITPDNVTRSLKENVISEKNNPIVPVIFLPKRARV